MQKWYNDGYFSPDLLMKRTHVDTDWTSLGVLSHRAHGENLFLSPAPTSLLPPGLTGRTDSPLQNLPNSSDQLGYNPPYQPALPRPLRATTLDSFISSTSNPSDSPSSSFSVGRYGSPDPSAFGGRAGVNPHTIGEPAVGSRVGSFSSLTEPRASFSVARRSNTLNEPPTERSVGCAPTFGNVATGGASSENHDGSFKSGFAPNQPWSGSSSNHMGSGSDVPSAGRKAEDVVSFSSSFTPASGIGPKPLLHQQAGFGNSGGLHDPTSSDGSASAALSSNENNTLGELGRDSQPIRSVMDNTVIATSGFGYDNYPSGLADSAFTVLSQNQQFTPSPSLHSAAAQQNHPGSSNSNFYAQTPSVLASSCVNHSPWNSQEPSVRRPGPFDPLHPTASNVIQSNNTTARKPTTPSQPAPWNRTNQNSYGGSQPELSPWYAASQNVPDDSWKDVTAPIAQETPGPDSLTFSNLGQHNQQQLQQELKVPVSNHSPVEAQTTSEPVAPRPSEVEPVQQDLPESSAAAPPPIGKTRRKVSTSQVQPPPIHTPSALSPVVTQVKPAWSTDEEVKQAKPSGLSIGLREIQEAEAKKMEARRAAERERERAARYATSSSVNKDDIQPFTASWGLPTSQAGSARNTANPKESSNVSSSNPTTSISPVWTNNSNPPSTKKTMKEIQEEEERRKKTAVKETTAAAAARRVHAEPITKVGSSGVNFLLFDSIPCFQTTSVPSTGGAWTTVGASGKPSSAILTAARPATTPLSSTQSSPSAPRINGTTPPRQAATPTVVKSSPRPVKVEDHSSSPSHEFLKWLSDSLKGLNSSVNGTRR
jgi:PERQ amino acid-rich with GYF domain-containing protein